ncbi:hypothetical protein Y013_06315 [Rhodococcus pyridinivorans SB3094]|uniref:Carboxypeptidase regulatory-like domain-containing protein n=1 Tax=Rhodococcus pyridinivorans SB3094 TaxID=1435356 RepID=V9XMM5_9NOCA|nr:MULTISPECIES: hypothetical protein [Rhodococcus]AHD23653.1 hypothetical protein Y013_06315 [Rhodococcus pyridinivorans SB3094]MCT7292922.1 hypothetical protein [Rhodococcus sp. PAE-6]
MLITALGAGVLVAATTHQPDSVVRADPTVAHARSSHSSVSVCAPPDGAPAWRPDELGDHPDPPAAIGAVANGRIGGVFHPSTTIRLTGLDVCEQYIDRTIVTTNDGWFLFTGLMPGRYTLRGDDGRVLTEVEVSAESSDHSGLVLAPG